MGSLSFQIEDRNSVLNSMKLPTIRYHKRITFSSGVILDYYFTDWVYQNKHYVSIEDLLEDLPADIQECILFNIEIFRKV